MSSDGADIEAFSAIKMYDNDRELLEKEMVSESDGREDMMIIFG